MGIEASVNHTPVINFSMQQNHVPVVRDISIKNTGTEELPPLCVELTFDPAFAETAVLHTSPLAPGAETRIDTIPLAISTSYLSNLTERITAHIHLRISDDTGTTLHTQTCETALLAFDQWGGLAVLPEMLAAFVTPNHPALVPVIRRASEILASWTGSPALDEYQTRDPNRVKAQMAAIYEAIAEQRIAYCTVPASFEDYGQRIRLADDIIANKLATCLDMALLYASCLEAAGIHPLIVCVKGHAFAGGWLIPDSFPDSVNDDVSLLTKRMADGINELLLVETTCMNSGAASVAFDDAVASASSRLHDTEAFTLFVDVLRARIARIRPLPQRVVRDGIYEIADNPCDSAAERHAEAPSQLSATDIIVDTDRIEVGKQTIWERKLLDLSLRNNLLNTRITKNTLQLISVKVNELEDALADGQEFQILPKPTDWDNPLMSAGIYQAIHANDPVLDLIDGELRQRRLRSYLAEEPLQRALTHLYRSSRTSMEENGANTLYLAIGLLKWFETPSSTRPRFAPILLLPIEIIRKSAAKGFVIRSRDEETMLNITLLEMLRQFFGIAIGGLDTLPRDESGVDVPRIFNIIRRAIMTQPGWDVEEQAIAGIFSFSKFIMWNDIHNNADKLARNRIVASLISGTTECLQDSDDDTDPADLDAAYPAGEIALPISADSSQLAAICAAVARKSFILHGPPGTGKSQTITNIIANCLYRGKKVLFVAEKMAALQVVQRRLEAIGLAPFCLELHSNKTKKANVLDQLKRTTEVARRKPSEAYALEARQINALRGELNACVNALHRMHPAGLSLYDCLARYADTRPTAAAPASIPDTTLSGATPASLADADVAVAEYQTMCRICGSPATHPLREIGLTAYSGALREDVRQLLESLADALADYSTLHAKVATLTGHDPSATTADGRQALRRIASALIEAPELPAQLLRADGSSGLFDAMADASRIGLERDAARDEILAGYSPRILTIDAATLEAQWRQCAAKWWLPRVLGQRKIRALIRPYATVTPDLSEPALLRLLSEIDTCQERQAALGRLMPALTEVFGNRFDPDTADWQRVAAAGIATEALRHDILTLTADTATASAVAGKLAEAVGYGLPSFRQLHADTLRRFIDSGDTVSALSARAADMLSATGLDADPDTRLSMVRRWLGALDTLHDRAAYNLARQRMAALGYGIIADAAESGRITPDEVQPFYHRSLYRSYAEMILAGEPELNAFHGTLFEEKVERFRDMCSRFERLTRDELFARLASSLPALQKEAAQSSEVGILQRNIRNGGRGTSLRRLFDQIPDLLTRMCPCMLMSPISVAQYIDAGGAPFDLVIFDEASQMPTSEAVGAIARGSSVIVVGDPKQMPPTSFFSTNAYDESNADKEDMESILDDCLALSMPSRYLLWHYRSRHESLIAFSNVKYYENRLLTFPSPDDLATKVGWQHVADGTYDRGRTRQNHAEAIAVVEEIRRRLTDPATAGQSIGVVTFNTNQQSLIDDLLTDLFRRDPALETAASECDEPIFVKNLENVQGDERDVILFSIGYGPDPEGRIALNFGPLNRDGGWRRLNVAVSRARYEMKVFSTLRADQIDLNRTSAEGVAGLKAFLEYAEKGRGALYYDVAKGRHTDDALIRAIAAELTARGYTVRTDVGCSGYKVDLGVIDPDNPDRYLLGILCDGYNYRSALTARDRVVTQDSVLRALGWRLHRIWAMDWWENSTRVVDSAVEAIEKARHGAEPSVETPMKAAAPEPTPEAAEPEPNPEPEPDPAVKPYTVCALRREEISPDELVAGHYDSHILQKILDVVDAEAPVSRQLLCRRVISSLGIARMGARLAVFMDYMLQSAGLTVSGSADSPFYWRRGENPADLRTYRPVSEREALDIAPEEVAVAACRILEDQGAMAPDSLLRECAHAFGYTRMGDNVVASMQRGIDYAMTAGRIVSAADRVRIV